MILAHDWKILGDKRIQKWPDGKKWPEKRAIRVNINTWIGTSAIGASHYHVSVSEEKNRWWSEKEDDWVELSCDTGSQGLYMSASTLTLKAAVFVAKAYIEAIAGKSLRKHRLIWDGPGRPKGAL